MGQSTNGCMGNDAQWYTTRYLRWINSLSRNLCKAVWRKDIGMTLVGRIGSHIFIDGTKKVIDFKQPQMCII